MDDLYSKQFMAPDKALTYERDVYDAKSYSSIVWRLEQDLLIRLLDEFRRQTGCTAIDYLDFAAGTGRILAHLENRVARATGIEISPAMIAVAKTKVARAKILCCDITRPDADCEGQYDLITAFRFVLNADPDLRLRAMRALAARLKRENSWLIFNNHCNPFSAKILMWPVHVMRRLAGRRTCFGNYLSHRSVMRLIQDAGLRLEMVTGYGFLGGRLGELLPMGMACKIEKFLAGFPILSRYGTHQCYVVRR